MKRKIISILLIMILVMITFIPTVKATLESDKKEIQDKVNEANNQKNQVSNEKKTTLGEISDLEDSITKYENELTTLKANISKLEKQIKTKTEEMEKLQKEYDRKRQLLEDRLVAIYEEGEISFLDVLLSSENIWDYISMNSRIQEMTEATNKQMDELEGQRQTVEKAKNELQESKTKLDNDKKSVEAKQKQLAVVKQSKQAKVDNLSAKEKEIQKNLDAYYKEIREIDEKIRAAANQASGIYNGSFSGRLGWPLSSNSYGYNIITSGFGSRDIPVAGATSDHRGIDIGVGMKTPVYASADGYVISVERTSARGIYVLIKHANDLYTRYQHLNNSVVSEGQYVTRAQLIAYSGNTGIGSGPHLHFEVLRTHYYMTEISPLYCGLLDKPSNLIYW